MSQSSGQSPRAARCEMYNKKDCLEVNRYKFKLFIPIV